MGRTYLSRTDSLTLKQQNQKAREIAQDVHGELAYALLYKAVENPKRDPVSRNRKAIAQEAINMLHDEAVAKSHRQWRDVERLMDCRNIDKYSGEHGRIPGPAPKRELPRLTFNATMSYLRNGGYVRYDYAQQRREVFWGGHKMGVITNDVLAKCVRELRLCEEHMARQHASKYYVKK